MNTYKIAVAAYLMSGIIAYGHYVNNSNDKYVNYFGEVKLRTSEQIAAGGMLAAMLSPLYWSDVAFRE